MIYDELKFLVVKIFLISAFIYPFIHSFLISLFIKDVILIFTEFVLQFHPYQYIIDLLIFYFPPLYFDIILFAKLHSKILFLELIIVSISPRLNILFIEFLSHFKSLLILQSFFDVFLIIIYLFNNLLSLFF